MKGRRIFLGHLWRSYWLDFEPDGRLVQPYSATMLGVKTNMPRRRNRIMVHEGLLGAENYWLETLARIARETDRNLFIRRFHGLVERETIKSPHESIPGSEDFLKDDLDIYFDFGIAAATKELSPQKLERSMWVLPVNLTTGIATLDPFLRYIATLKLKRSIYASLKAEGDPAKKIKIADYYLEAEKNFSVCNPLFERPSHTALTQCLFNTFNVSALPDPNLSKNKPNCNLFDYPRKTNNNELWKMIMSEDHQSSKLNTSS